MYFYVAYNLFEISEYDGKVFCHPGINREKHGQYVLSISASASEQRAKRSVDMQGLLSDFLYLQ